jgi:hypothetical protein
MKTLATLLLILFQTLALHASDDENWSMGPLGGTFQIVPASNLITVRSTPAGSPAATAGLQVGDRIFGAFGEPFRPINNYFTGSVQDFGSAIDRAEANGGTLPLEILRPGTGKITLTVNLPPVGAFGPAFPLGSPKFQTLYETSCASIHSNATSWFGGAAKSPTDGSLTNLGWMGLLMLSHPNWADTTGTKPYRNSINTLRNQTVAVLNNIVLAPVEADQPGHVDPGLENWQIASITMFLAEYINKTGDTTPMPTLQRACDALANRIQNYDAYPGHMSHGGVVGDYGNWALNIINVHAHAAFSMAKRAGATIDQTKWDLSWNVLKQSTARSDGHPEDGYVDYGPPAWGQGSGWDASARTPGSIFAFLNYGQTPTPDDADALNRMKGYVVRQHERFQIAHAYTVGGVCFTQLALPYLEDRAQRHILDNTRYFYQFHRTHTADLAYFGGRGNNGGDSYLNFNHVKLYNAAFAMAVANGGLPSLPPPNTQRIHANMKSPWTRWPTLEAKTATLNGLSHTLDVEITDWQGTPLTSGYTATWSQISGPATATIATPSSPATAVTFPAGGRYRLQLTATTPSYTTTELYDLDVNPNPTPSGFSPGIVGCEIFSGIAGTTVANLTSAPAFTNNQPSLVTTLTSLETTHAADSYGQRVTGVIIPPASGDYRFHIASDDSSQFRLNPTGPDPAGLSTLCSCPSAVTQYNWTANPAQQSALVTLVAGQPYAFEILHKEGTGADRCAVAWTGPGIATPTVIGSSSIAMPEATTIIRQPVSRTATLGATANFDLLVAGPGPFLYEWRLDGIPYWGQSTTPALTIPNVGTGSAGTYTCVITTPAGTTTSSPATLSLNTTSSLTQGLRREVWNNLSGSAVSSLTASTLYPRFPDSTSIVTTAETAENYGENYGQRLSGWIIPPTTGSYRFYLSSDDASQLWLSTNDSPSNKALRAQITGYSNFRTYTASSSTLTLTAGQRYYIEILHKEGGGGDHLSLAWQLPGGPAPTTGTLPIPAEFLECTTESADPLAIGLTAWWKMDESPSPIALDATSTAADAQITGATWTTGRRLGALTFSGSQFLSCGNRASLSGTTPFSITAWIRVNSGNTQEGVILQQRAPNGFNGQYQFTVNSTGKLRFYCYGNSAEQFNFAGATSVNTGQWVHVAAVRDASGNAYLYLNGVLDGSVTGTTIRSLSSSIDMGIGADIRDSNRFFRGALDDIRLYNRVLPPAEISQIRNQAPAFSANPIDAGIATVGVPFSSTLASSASDPDLGESFTWQKISGPSWLTVAPNGSLSGTPASENSGPNTFVVRVTDSIGAATDATLNINVVTIYQLVTVEPGTATTAEGNPDPATFILTRDATTGPLTVPFSLGGTATPDTDYITPETTVSFADGEASATVSITLVNDLLLEPDETVTFTILPGNDHIPGTPASATITIIDNDGPQPIGPPWTAMNIGSVATGNTSSVTFAAGEQNSDRYAITGSGTLGQNTTSDGFRFVGMQVPGDCEITARVISQNTSVNGRRAGVMIRESNAANSRHAAMVLRSNVQPWFIHRTVTGGNSSRVQHASNITPPHWVRLVRSGNTLTGFISPDGLDWTQVGQQTVTLGTTPWVGLAVASGATNATNAATFDQVVIRQPLTVTSTLGGITTGGGWLPRLTQQPISATPGPNHQFVSWSGTGIIDPNSTTTTVLIDTAKTITATFIPIQHTLTVSGGTGSGTYNQGTTQPITAEVPENQMFVSWSGTGVTDPNSPTTTVLIDAAKTITATFAPIQHTLTIIGGTGSGTYNQGTTQPITAEVPENQMFVSWSGTGVTDPNSPTTTVLIDTAKTITATFAPIQHTLTVSGGTGSGTYNQGTTQPITAEVPENQMFVSWSGTGITDPNSPTTTVLINTAKTITATFAPIQHTLTIIGGTGSGTYNQGTTQPITATVPENQMFVSWSGTGITDPNSPTTTVLIDTAKTITATFAPIQHTLTVSGGTGSGTYNQGTTQPITAEVPENQMFVSWSGTGITDPNSPTTTVLIDTAKTITATFAPIDPYLLWVAGFDLTGPQAEPDADADLDGTPNRAEMLLGFDPTDSNKYLKLIIPQVTPTHLTFTINRVASGGTFILQSTADLTGSWTDDLTLNFTELADDHTFQRPKSEENRFYRVLFIPTPQ